MTKRTKYIYILGSIAIGVILAAIVLLALFAGGGTGSKKPSLVIMSGSQEFVHDGTAHTDDHWELVGGELSDGQRILVDMTGSRTDAGTGKNTFSAKVVDGNGSDVSSDYSIEYRFGTLTVKPIGITVSTLSGTKVYDGTALACPEYKVTSKTGLLAGHKFTRVEMPAERVDVGVSENYISEIVVSDGTREVTSNYTFAYHYGELTITPRNLTIRSGSAEKAYDGLPLICDEWELVSFTQPVGGKAPIPLPKSSCTTAQKTSRTTTRS